MVPIEAIVMRIHPPHHLYFYDLDVYWTDRLVAQSMFEVPALE